MGVLKIVRVLYLISSYSFLEPYWAGCQCVETNPFLQFLIYLIYVIFEFDLYPLVYSLCTWVSFFYINKSLLLRKKFKKIKIFLKM